MLGTVVHFETRELGAGRYCDKFIYLYLMYGLVFWLKPSPSQDRRIILELSDVPNVLLGWCNC